MAEHIGAEEARRLLDAATPAPPERCVDTLGSRPSWMGVDQYDPCRCSLPNGHDGDHCCSHGAREPNNHRGVKRGERPDRVAVAELAAAAPRLAAEVVRLNEQLRVQGEQLDTLRNAIREHRESALCNGFMFVADRERDLWDALDALAAAGGGVPEEGD